MQVFFFLCGSVRAGAVSQQTHESELWKRRLWDLSCFCCLWLRRRHGRVGSALPHEQKTAPADRGGQIRAAWLSVTLERTFHTCVRVPSKANGKPHRRHWTYKAVRSRHPSQTPAPLSSSQLSFLIDSKKATRRTITSALKQSLISSDHMEALNAGGTAVNVHTTRPLEIPVWGWGGCTRVSEQLPLQPR